MSGYIFHILKGLTGNSIKKRIDVNNIEKVISRERFFCFFDKEYPYEINVFCNKKTTNNELICYSARYKTVEECEKEKKEIINKQWKNHVLKQLIICKLIKI